MKKLLSLLSIFTFVLFLTSCSGEDPKEEIVIEENFVDDANAEETAADTSSTGVYQEDGVEEEASLQNAMKADAEPVVEEEGMSFCDCVKKNKTLSDKMMSDDVSDTDFDKAMEELEAM